MQQYAKFWVGLLSAIATTLLTVLPPDTQAWQVVTIVAALLGAILVYLVPNAPAGEALPPA